MNNRRSGRWPQTSPPAEDEQEQLPLDAQQAEEQYRKAMDKALYYLGLKARSQAKMQQYLLGKGFRTETIAAVMDKLQEYGYLNDRLLAEQLLENGQTQRREGARKTRQRMMQQGIQDQLFDEVLAQPDAQTEQDNAAYWAEKWLPKLTGELPQRKQKLYRRLVSKGFSYAAIHHVMRQLEWELPAADDPDQA